MSCRLDVRDAILDNIMDKFVTGRNTFERVSKDVVSIVGGMDNKASKAKKASQARAIAETLARRASEYTNKHVMGWVNRTSEYEPYTVTFVVSPAYVEQEYRKLPKEKQTDPADKQLSKEDTVVLEAHKNKLGSFLRMLADSSPVEFLKFVAEQYYGISPDGTQFARSASLPVPEIVELATKVFPRSDFIGPMNQPPVEPEC